MMKNTKTSKKLLLLWSVLWFGLQIFIGVMFYLSNGQRINVPYGQYVFFAVGLIISVILIIYYRRQLVESTSKFFLLMMLMLFGMCFISGTVALSQFILLTILAWHVGRFSDAYFIMIIVSSLLGFLCFNFPYWKQIPSKIFMGDVGSALIGVLLAWFLISLSQAPVKAANPVVFLWIMAIPCFDLISVILRRLYNKKSPFKADHEHLHHLLRRAGLSTLSTVMIILLLSLLFGLAGIGMSFAHVSESTMFIILFMCFIGYMFLVNHGNLLPRTIELFTRYGSRENAG